MIIIHGGATVYEHIIIYVFSALCRRAAVSNNDHCADDNGGVW